MIGSSLKDTKGYIFACGCIYGSQGALLKKMVKLCHIINIIVALFRTTIREQIVSDSQLFVIKKS